jgi:nucleotide-binding universal stress UspA family protein
MLPIRTILVPTDFSERSDYAFRLACTVARDCDARLTVMHVVPLPMALYTGGVMTPEPDRHEQEWAQLRRLQAADPRVQIEYLLAEGDPGPTIVQAARDNKYDLIVMGTHGRTGLSRALLGSVAEMVMRKASCPVVTVRSPSAAEASS